MSARSTMIYRCDVCGKEFETFGECDERFTLSPPCKIARKWERMKTHSQQTDKAKPTHA